MRSHYRLMPLHIAKRLTDAERLEAIEQGWLLPIAGAEHVGAGEGDGDGSGEGTGSGDGPGGEGEGEPTGSGEGEGEEDTDEDDPDDVLELKRSEYERMRRIVREHDNDKKKREQAERKEREKRAREQGQYEDLLKEKDEQTQAAEAERDEAKYQLDAYRRRIRVQAAAVRLGFKDPEDASKFLTEEDTEDDTSTERALRKLARDKSYLVQERRSTGAPVGGDGVSLTLDQIKNMSEDEINDRWEEVQKAMANTG
jgi:hypothetical protein